MVVTFYINYLNHHQVLIADEMYKILGDHFHFVATAVRNQHELKGGKDYSVRPYCLLAAERPADNEKAHELNRTSDVCVFGSGNLSWERERATTGKLSFEVSERWLKRGWINILSPRLIQWWWLYQTRLRSKPFYKLCCSAFTASDCAKLLSFKGKCYKWGYFTGVNRATEVSHPQDENVRILWCARFLALKHPELAVELAARLKKEGYKFHLDMIGDGVVFEKTRRQAMELGVMDVLTFQGSLPNTQVLDWMKQSDIFLFTSDQNEGWGAVSNEAMSNQCVLVGSDGIGSVPYLVKDGVTGSIFKSGDIDSLYQKVKYLLDHPDRRAEMADNAYRQMTELWNPAVAASRLMQLIEALAAGKDSPFGDGPCSKAL